jgi:hypothetical protein
MAKKRTPEAQAVLDALDEDLERAGQREGKHLSWTAQEAVTLELIGSTIDRRVDVVKLYDAAVDAKIKVKLSQEIRLLDAAVVRMLAKVNTETPAPMSLRSVKAQAAARVRWAKDA